VLQGGVIVERGTHEELLRQRGIYYTAAALQAADRESVALLDGFRGPA